MTRWTIILVAIAACSCAPSHQQVILGDREILFIETCDSAVVYGANGDTVPAERLTGRYAHSPQMEAELISAWKAVHQK